MERKICFTKTGYLIKRSFTKEDKLNANNHIPVVEYDSGESEEDYLLRIIKEYGIIDNKASSIKDIKENYNSYKSYYEAESNLLKDHEDALEEYKKYLKNPEFKTRLIKEVYGFKLFKIEHIKEEKYLCIYTNDSEHYDIELDIKLNFNGDIPDFLIGELQNNLINLFKNKYSKIEGYQVKIDDFDKLDNLFIEIITPQQEEITGRANIIIVDEEIDFDISKDIIDYFKN